MVSQRWRIRRADESDVAGIATAHIQSWIDAYSDILPADELASRTQAVRERQWSERLADDDFVVSVAESPILGLVGFVAVSCSGDEDLPGTTGELVGLYLIEAAWGEGLGRKMLEVAIDCLARRGFTEAGLWVLRDNERARRFYEANGWRADGSTKDCFGGVTAPAVRYRRSLTTPQA
jgi:GNAT superfamily N-acetyltransferase